MTFGFHVGFSNYAKHDLYFHVSDCINVTTLMRKGKATFYFILDHSNYEPEPFEVHTIMPVAELLACSL